MSTETVAAMLGASKQVALAIEHTCIMFDIESTLEKSHFLAQMMVESQNFTVTRENLNYSVVGLLTTFGRHRISEANARRFGRTSTQRANQEAIANLIYGGEFGRTQLGNLAPGDGWKFIGRGYKQLTGRANYTAYSRAVYGDYRCVDNPQMLELLPDAMRSAGWFWKSKGVGEYAARDDVYGVTLKVNGGLNGYEDRKKALALAKAAFASITHRG